VRRRIQSLIRWSAALAAFSLPTLSVGTLVGVYGGHYVAERVWTDAKFCISCHVHDYANFGWEKSIHGDKTTCHDCHHQPMRAYFKEMYVMITKRPQFPEDLHHTPFIKQDLCAACHVSNAADRSSITGPMKFEDVSRIPKVDKSELHRVHLEAFTDLTLLNSHELTEGERRAEPISKFPVTRGEKRSVTCADCHGGPANRAHNFSAVDASCVRCHSEPHQTRVGEVFGCRDCHFKGFLIPESAKMVLKETFKDKLYPPEKN
jgi:hypothetical protein